MLVASIRFPVAMLFRLREKRKEGRLGAGAVLFPVLFETHYNMFRSCRFLQVLRILVDLAKVKRA